MIKRLQSYWHLRKNRFSHSIAHVRGSVMTFREKDLWAYYRLGMYASVAQTDKKVSHRLALHAKAVSYAAVGDAAKAEETVHAMLKRRDCKPHLVSLSDALAPYMPELSLKILANVKAPETLEAALLMRVCNFKAAKRVLKTAFLKQKHLSQPELFLYSSNAATKMTPQKRLQYLNEFFAFHGVSSVQLKDTALPPSPLNVKIKDQLPECNGPLVSVLMTTFETGERASVAIESILQQTYKNIELIVIDDASNDDTLQIIEEWKRKDARVRFIQLPKNVGTYVAKNIGLLQAKGEFVTCHDSDDWSHPLKIELHVQPLVKNEKLMATISYWIRMQDDGIYYARPVHPMIRQNPSSLLFRREKVLNEAGLWDCVRTGADSEYIARLKLMYGKSKVKRIRKSLSLGSHREDSLMTSCSTGYSTDSVSPQRLEYWEAWSYWHLDCLQDKKMPSMSKSIDENMKQRKFKAPEKIIPNSENVQECLKA